MKKKIKLRKIILPLFCVLIIFHIASIGLFSNYGATKHDGFIQGDIAILQIGGVLLVIAFYQLIKFISERPKNVEEEENNQDVTQEIFAKNTTFYKTKPAPIATFDSFNSRLTELL